VQRTIRTEFKDATLLCIAHRLNTIGKTMITCCFLSCTSDSFVLLVVYYDRILVMDAGKVAEFDTVLNLFDKEDSIFRGLCEQANLSRTDILRIRTENTDGPGP
jgi:ATP-binding cassette, subfamily C (CFTR/MRP), member 1